MGDTTTGIYASLEKLRRGDPKARDELIGLACRRLTALTRKMLNDYDRLRRFEQTDDVSQNAAMRLHRALDQVHPKSVAEFFGLAALKIRQELHDQARHYYGRNPKNSGDCGPRTPDLSPAHAVAGGGEEACGLEPADSTFDPARLAQWTEFHKAVECLPEKERQVVDLLFYHELSQADTAAVLEVDTSTVKRRWRSARLKLHELLKNTLPDF
ncbi:MAG TPA: sigma-70 family RNA polymerase sigma factor [Pirellulales bacterium]|nr:sigma-70 family RNA polymerase sigma factor [Pirellulales bacterium]